MSWIDFDDYIQIASDLFYSSESHCGMAELLCKELENISCKPPPFQVSVADTQSM